MFVHLFFLNDTIDILDNPDSKFMQVVNFVKNYRILYFNTNMACIF